VSQVTAYRLHGNSRDVARMLADGVAKLGTFELWNDRTRTVTVGQAPVAAIWSPPPACSITITYFNGPAHSVPLPARLRKDAPSVPRFDISAPSV